MISRTVYLFIFSFYFQLHLCNVPLMSGWDALALPVLTNAVSLLFDTLSRHRAKETGQLCPDFDVNNRYDIASLDRRRL